MQVNNNFSFTIIIPFYETINYVEQTLRSIFNQENFPIGRVQVLLIDDGSPQQIQPILTRLKNEKFQIEYHRKTNAN
jgi:glycosyltransferase involved in cell wall biosynthesis